MGFLNKVFGKKEDEKVVSNSDLTHVFISYGSRDMDVAEEVCDLVESCNLKCWIAPRDVKSGGDYSQQIIDNVETSNVLIFISSKDTYQSMYIKNELKVASQNNIPIIGFKIDGFLPDNEWMYLLGNARWVDAFPDYRKHYKSLMEALREEYNSQGLHRAINMSAFKENKPPKDSFEESSSPKTTINAHSGDEPYVFISYKHADTDLVVPIIERFQQRGYNVWFDQGLKYGEDYDDLIDLKINGSALFIIFITENVIKGAYSPDEYMKKELDVAIATNTKIFPIFLHHVGLEGKYRMHLIGKHSIFRHEYESEEEFIDDCIAAFKKDFELYPSM